MKIKMIAVVVGMAASCLGLAQRLPELKLFSPSTHHDFGSATWHSQDRLTLADWDHITFGYDPYTPRWTTLQFEFGFSSRFDPKKLSFKGIFGRDSGFEFRSSDYIPGVRGTRISKTGGEIWIRL
jgi:hypothetical protein